MQLPRPKSQNPGEDWAYAMARDLAGASSAFVVKKLRQIYDAAQGLNVTCNGCGKAIEEPGGLLFGPPFEDRCKKDHLCTECYKLTHSFVRRIHVGVRSEKKEADPEERKRLIEQAQETGDCPFCGAEMDHEGYHERDSTYDKHRCSGCGWNYIEMESWT